MEAVGPRLPRVLDVNTLPNVVVVASTTLNLHALHDESIFAARDLGHLELRRGAALLWCGWLLDHPTELEMPRRIEGGDGLGVEGRHLAEQCRQLRVIGGGVRRGEEPAVAVLLHVQREVRCTQLHAREQVVVVPRHARPVRTIDDCAENLEPRSEREIVGVPAYGGGGTLVSAGFG